VRTRAGRYGSDRKRHGEAIGPFRNRSVGEVLELTSRVNTDQVAEAKQLLEAPFDGTRKVVDVALATNMISVGLDISRLGLMIVQGQPKTAAEYIQATSRVGRDFHRPGLVVTVLNLHKPRDRMHYEQFGHFHRTFYRAVEATSVTPWAARALDRALAAVVVTLARYIEPALTPELAAQELQDHDPVWQLVCDALLARAPASLVAGGHAALRDAIEGLLRDWVTVAEEMTRNGGAFNYGKRPHHLLYDPLDPALANLSPEHQRFTAGRSMRDVEPNAYLKVRDPSGARIANAADLD
jgi:hypothetical protein